MTRSRPKTSSEYMHWARMRPGARFDLAGSGMGNLPLSQLPINFAKLELTGGTGYGYEPLKKLLAVRYQVDPACIVTATGTSMANHLAMAAVLEPGDEVLIEQPTYELLLNVADYLGATVRRFPRRFENAFRLDPTEIERAITPSTRLIVLTNLHNPSGVLIDESTLRQVGDLARSARARVFVDEVYLDMAFTRPQRSAIHLGENFIVTSSLTKAYGLSGLRCGWVFAEPKLAERMWRLNDLFGATPVHLAEQISVIALERLDELAAQTCRLLETNRALLKTFFDSRDVSYVAPKDASQGDCEKDVLQKNVSHANPTRSHLSVVWPEFGTIAFPKFHLGGAGAFCQRLLEEYETAVVPGSFFEMPEHFRIGVGGETKMVAEGLGRLVAALDDEMA